MIRSLQLDADEEPRRLGATSRANSVRFDESANQGQWSHAARSSAELFPKLTGGIGGLGGHGLFERSLSHKSDGRHSSAGHSAVSGRANSLGLDVSDNLSHAALEAPGLAPGLLLLGSVPTIVRCWLTQNFRHESLLYAAVCTGSYRSLLDQRIVTALGLDHMVHQDINGHKRVKMSVYLPEAVPMNILPRTNNSAPQLPSFTVDFTIVDGSEHTTSAKAIQIFLGSDALRAHHADVLFSSNQLTLFDDEGRKLSVPFVRPENDETFKTLYTTSGSPVSARSSRRIHLDAKTIKHANYSETPDNETDPDIVARDGQGVEQDHGAKADTSFSTSLPSGMEHANHATIHGESAAENLDHGQKPSLSSLTTWKADSRDEADHVTSPSSTARAPALRSNWRRDGNGSLSGTSDWATVPRHTSTNYSRTNRDQGMKVLRTSRQSTRSSTTPVSGSSADPALSRGFEETTRRNGSSSGALGGSSSDSGESSGQFKRSASVELNDKSSIKDNVVPASRIRVANPIGGASAFGWLNSSQAAK
ncbi:MAG: CSN-associated deubiquitinating enzyme Ubp12 [Chrysothrix sp. TS-e1954]|nr:MAG: CSN-associated deubiquitinating enzyme Ubp12 [Chrysothrix sp. TS-e1954]